MSAHSSLSVPMPDMRRHVSSKIALARPKSHSGAAGQPPLVEGSSGLMRHF
jgi:hypothetical protein